jgi:glycosyltransferase involved in cell wall biosynthesis
MTSMAEPGTTERRVLVVEDRAHRPVGHYPTRFARLAEGFVADGCVVEALTADGWLLDGRQPVPFVVRRYGAVDRFLYRFGEAFGATRGLRNVSRAARSLALARAALARVRRAGDPRPDVVVVAQGIDPLVASAFAGPGRWLFYEFGSISRAQLHYRKRARRAEERRRAAGGRARIATPNDADRDEWADTAPFLDPVTLPIAGTWARERVPDARSRLGFATEDRIALVFGTAHPDKDVDVVARVFAELPDWQVVVAGTVAASYRGRAGARDAIVVGGYVDDATRDLVYSAADLVVLSFRPDFGRDSGVLMDAVSFGVPVVASDRSVPAEIVREYGLGTVFEPGNPDSLERAIATAPSRVDPGDLDRARTDLSNRTVAHRLLEVLSERRSTGRDDLQ